jgi:DNA gyrase subunit A
MKPGTKTPHRFRDRSGIVKKSNLSDYSNVRKGGIIAINIEEDDCLIDAVLRAATTKSCSSLRGHESALPRR